jgi:uncharacterized membrane protein
VRFSEIDALRGSAVIAMIVFHAFYDLNFVGYVNIEFSSGFWWFFPRVIASVFIFVAGVSLSLSYSGGKVSFSHYLRRGLMLFSLGLVITVVTYLFVPYAYIRFGILHFMGVATIMVFPFLRSDSSALIAAVLSLILGLKLRDVYSPFPYLLWMGVKPISFYTLDYFPIFPWLGLMLFGIAMGNLLYPNHQSRWNVRELWALNPLAVIGRHSLLIYLLHQPVLLFFIMLIGKII